MNTSEGTAVTVAVTVPPVGEGLTGWRRIVTGVRTSRTGKTVYEGEQYLEPGDVLGVPAGTVVLAVDAKTLRRSYDHATGQGHDVKDARVALYVAAEGGLRREWARDFKTSSAVHGAAVEKQLRALLEAHPQQGGEPEVTVVEGVQRPNHHTGRCRWVACGQEVPAGVGHLLGSGSDAQVEHWQTCPPYYRCTPVEGAQCALCSVTIRDRSEGIARMVREGDGRWEAVHRPELDCPNRPQQSYEERRAQHAADRARRKEIERKAGVSAVRRKAKEEEKRAAAKAAADAAHATEQARVAGLATVKRTSIELSNKSIGRGERVRLMAHLDTLEDGTTTNRWSVEVYPDPVSRGWTGEDYDPMPAPEPAEYTRLPDAQADYGDWKFRKELPVQHRTATLDPPCPGQDTEHCDNCGNLTAPAGWMRANRGRACDETCYDAMSDAPGRHARRHHHHG